MKESTSFKVLKQTPEHDFTGYGTVLALLLDQRGLTPKTAQNFLYPSYGSISNPFLMNDMLEAVLRIESAIKEHEKIVIYCDYDADGVPGGALLYEFFKKIGVSKEDIIVYIPHRHEEGYGLHSLALDSLQELGVDLVITVDLGIRAVDQVAHANSLGIDVIITDHHEPGEKVPDSFALINPKIGDKYPDRMLCGCAVAFQLVRALLFHLKKNEYPPAQEIPDGWEKWLLDLVGISTVSDMVPLVNENRMLAKYGLGVLRKTRRKGLVSLLRVTRTVASNIKEDDVGFTISPRINAASRMDHASKAFDMLTAEDSASAEEAARYLDKLNTKRKTTTATIMKAAYAKLENKEIRDVVVIGDPDWNHGVVGIVASKIVEKYGKPAFVWSRSSGGVVKGSCRADSVASVVNLMESLPKEALLGFGGHSGAGGFSCDTSSILTLEDKLCKAYQDLYKNIEKEPPATEVHLRIKASDLTRSLYNEISLMEPFGVGNVKPIFSIEDAFIISCDFFGKTKEHTKLILKTPTGTMEAIAFFKVPADFSYSPNNGDTVCLIGNYEKSSFAGRTSLRILLLDILEHSL